MPTDNTRPNIPTIQLKADMSTEEMFQNNILRPIIKMKHDLFVAYLRDYLESKKEPLKGLSREKQIAYLESVFQRDINLRSELRGVILGQFTREEYLQYATIKNSINKRMLNIIQKRMIDHVEILSD